MVLSLPVEGRDVVQGKEEYAKGARSAQETSKAPLGRASAQGCWGGSGRGETLPRPAGSLGSETLLGGLRRWVPGTPAG